jgi:biopolymer transport protein TolQ
MGFDGLPVFMLMSGSFSELVANTGILAKTVLAILLVLSVVSWTIIFEKVRFFRRAGRESAKFRKAFEEERSLRVISEKAQKLQDSPEAALVRAVSGVVESGEVKDPANLDRYIDSGIETQVAEWESYLIFLSTTATVSPFLGLLGTVWGIMSSFLSMGVRGSANLYVIGPGIADALITTIFGLGAAIPAVIGYNYILRMVRRKEDDITSFSVRFRVRILERRYKELEGR